MAGLFPSIEHASCELQSSMMCVVLHITDCDAAKSCSQVKFQEGGKLKGPLGIGLAPHMPLDELAILVHGP